ncbi:MAG: uracil-DNA glycosylase [Methylobacteriaceae bacterium]|nr:uracil-DNA glycosylase [Methylobacteriaceae bacterium]
MSTHAPEDDRRAELAAFLAWCRDAGLDAAVEETPVDRFALADRPPARATEGRPTPAATAPPPERAAAAVAPAPDADIDPRGARSLDELRAMLERFEGCALRRTATQLVFADGAPTARIVLVGEAPGADEDRIGRPFVGRAGQLLDRMLATIGLDRTKVYICNVVPWRPPGNRTPTPQETALCLPFVTRQIELVAPEIVICLGASSARALLSIEEGILRARGKWREWRSDRHTARALATLHPAYLLRQPVHKRLAWRDLRLLRQALAPAPRPDL